MNLPKKHLKSPHGQILILFLLVLVLAMAVVLSVASRTVTDIKITTTSDESNRAYFAAEAGVEEALKKAETDTNITLRLDFPDISTTATTQLVDVGEGAREIYVYPFLVERDDIAQINMLNTYPVLASGWSGDLIEIYWGTDPDVSGGNVLEQAIEVSIMYYGSNFGMTKWGFDPSAHNNNFCTGATNVQKLTGGVLKADSKSGIEKRVYFRTVFDIKTGFVGGIDLTDECDPAVGSWPKHGPGTLGVGPVLLRIRPLYNTDPIPIVIESPEPPPFVPNQGNRIESVGKTASGVTRKIEVTTTYPAMPAIFDYVLFNGGTNPLTKN